MLARNLQSEYEQRTQEVYIVDKEVEWITAQEAADIMGVNVSNVYYLCRNGKINCRKWSRVWQVDKAEAEAYIRSERNPEWLHPE